MKKWNDKTKKIALVVALLIVGAGAFCGIRLTLKTDKPVETAKDIPVAAEEEEELTVNTEAEETEVQDTERLVISTEPIDSANTAETDDTTQSIQDNPIKTEENKPSEPPIEVTETERSDSSEKPENTEIPTSTEKALKTSNGSSSSTPKDGEIRDGKIYFEGFGWIDYNGGGTSGTQADDIYENGNTIGIME